MTITRRVYVSMPADHRLSERQNRLKWAIVDRAKALGYEPQIFTGPQGGTGLAAGKGWTIERVEEVMRRCVGAVLLGFPKWSAKLATGREAALPTEYCHYEGAVAFTHALPILGVLEKGTERSGIFIESGLELVLVPDDADLPWLDGPGFAGPFENWKRQLGERRDVFLGYCSTSRGTARNIKQYLTAQLGLTVLDWQEDFAPAGSILDEISEAVRRCSAGVFLFTKDDKIDAAAVKASPRDNVVFEAGVFVNAKGKDRVLIVREEGSKMPADLGGDIYASLDDRSDIGPIETYLQHFAHKRL